MKSKIVLYTMTYILSLIFSINIYSQNILSDIDTDLTGNVTDGIKGVQGVVVSDGYTTTLTDENGQYRMKRNPKAKFVFISVPCDYKLPTRGSIPDFYKKVNQDLEVVYANFQLTKAIPDKNFVLVAMADSQPSKDWELKRFRKETVPDINNLTKEYPSETSFVGIVAGDLVWDAPKLYPGYTDAINNITFPVLQVIGNHDHDQKIVGDDSKASHNFEKYFGPTYYSYNKGNCHFIVLDDILYHDRKTYEKKITDEQMEWLKQDLTYVAKDKLIILSTHIPTKYKQSELVNSKELYNILDGYKVVIISGHTHFGVSTEINENIKEYTLNAVFGAGWSGDIGSNGAPNGYAVFEIEGNKVTNQYFKGTGLDKSYQIKLYPPNSWNSKKNSIIANIWNWNKHWTVEVIEDGKPMGEMTQYRDYDPFAYEYMFGPDKPKHRPSNEPKQTSCLFFYTPKKEGSTIKVVAKDEYGNEFTEELNLKK